MAELLALESGFYSVAASSLAVNGHLLCLLASSLVVLVLSNFLLLYALG